MGLSANHRRANLINQNFRFTMMSLPVYTSFTLSDICAAATTAGKHANMNHDKVLCLYS